MVAKTLGELASILGAHLIGDRGVEIRGVSTLSEAREGELSFLGNPRYRDQATRSRASAILVPEAVEGIDSNLLVVRDPYAALATLLEIYAPSAPPPRGVDAAAFVDPGANVDPAAWVGPCASVARGARIGARTLLHAGVRVGEGARIGEDCVLMPNVVVRERCVLGSRVVVQPGAVIGSDGFGFASGEDGYRKVPQVGIVRVEDDVEIGANTTIDRASLGETRIGRGAKLDNLVQIAHNVVVGEHTAMAAQVGVSGSTEIGSHVRMGGQAGITGHVSIGDRATVSAQAGVIGDVPEGSFVSGFPARDHRVFLRATAETHRLAALRQRVSELETELEALREEFRGARGPRS